MDIKTKVIITLAVTILVISFTMTVNLNRVSPVTEQINKVNSDISSHNTKDDCWTIINGKVYDITSYIPFHPGGEQNILSVCGKDGTLAFETKGGLGESHKESTLALLETFYIGDVSDFQSLNSPKMNDTSMNDSSKELEKDLSKLTLDNIAKHNKENDCWLIINDRVYDVTSYIPFHPGGKQRIINECGGEATTAFNTQGGEGAHSDVAKSLLENYYIGDVDGSVGKPLVQEPAPVEEPVLVTLTIDEISKHNNENDCWLLIDSKVYDVTQYIPFHPGGKNRIIRECGGEATNAFDTRGGTGSHSSNARSLLNNFLLGDLDTQVSINKNQSQVIDNLIQNSYFDEEYEDEYEDD